MKNIKILRQQILDSLLNDHNNKKWKTEKLEKIANVNGGYSFKSENFSDSGVRIIRISDFNDNKILNKTIVRHPFIPEIKNFEIEHDNILIAMTGGTVGKICIVTDIVEKTYANQRVATLKIHKDFDPKYIYYFLMSTKIQNIILNNKNSTNDNISLKLIRNFEINFPCLAEQKSLAEKLDKIFLICNKYELNTVNIEKYKLQLKKAVIGDIFPNEFTIKNEHMKELQFWDFKKCAKFKIGKTPPTSQKKYWGEGIDWISIADMNHFNDVSSTKRKVTQLALSEIFKDDLVPKNTLLMSFKLTIGRLSITSKDSVHNEAIISIYPNPNINQKYLMYALESLNLELNVKNAIKGKTLNSKSISAIRIPVVPVEQQLEIAKKIEKIFDLIDQI